MHRVLIIEDDVETRLLLKRILEGGGFQTDAVWSGERGVEAAMSGRFDCVLLDLMMPEMDGFQVIHNLRKQEPTSGLPILVLTALQDEESRVRALQAGANEFLNKPVDARTLLETIRRHVRIKEER